MILFELRFKVQFPFTHYFSDFKYKNNNKYIFLLRYGLVNAINDYTRSKIRVESARNFEFNLSYQI